MNETPNQEIVNDTAKLIMHRLIARRLAHDPSLVKRAKASHERMAMRFLDRTFVQEWKGLLELSPDRLRNLLTSRHAEMRRLRLSSPFVTAEGIDFTEPNLRRRIRRAAKRIVERGTPGRRTVSTAAA